MPPPLSVTPGTRYDQAARYLLAAAGGRLFAWLLGPASGVRFVRWLPAQLTLPNAPQRVCDLVGELADDALGGRPVAALVEVQTVPDPTMPGRLMLAGGLLWLTLKPAALSGDRYDLLAVVVNLTGSGSAVRSCRVGSAEWTLRPVEVNLSELDAGGMIDEVATGTAPAELLAFVPLMRGGSDPATHARWVGVAKTVLTALGWPILTSTTVFADKANAGELWRKTVYESLLGMDPDEPVSEESPFFAEMMEKAKARAEARGEAKGEAKGEARGKAEALVRALGKRFGAMPETLGAAVRGCNDVSALDRWLDDALDATSLDDFRQRAGL